MYSTHRAVDLMPSTCSSLFPECVNPCIHFRVLHLCAQVQCLWTSCWKLCRHMLAKSGMTSTMMPINRRHGELTSTLMAVMTKTSLVPSEITSLCSAMTRVLLMLWPAQRSWMTTWWAHWLPSARVCHCHVCLGIGGVILSEGLACIIYHCHTEPRFLLRLMELGHV